MSWIWNITWPRSTKLTDVFSSDFIIIFPEKQRKSKNWKLIQNLILKKSNLPKSAISVLGKYFHDRRLSIADANKMLFYTLIN